MNLTPPLTVYWSKRKHPHCNDIQVIICKIFFLENLSIFLFANTELQKCSATEKLFYIGGQSPRVKNDKTVVVWSTSKTIL